MRIESLFNKVHSVRVALIGDFMIDLYTTGEVSRISPEAPVPVLKAGSDHRLPGGAGNVALNLRALGATVKVVGRVGSDVEGNFLRELLHKEGIEVEGLIQDRKFPTSVKHRLLAGAHQLLRIDHEQTPPLSESAWMQTKTFLEHHLDDVDVVAISDYGKGFLTDELLAWIIEWGQEHGKTVVVDPKGSDFSKYAGATMIKPNLKEAYEASGVTELDEAAEKIRQLTGCRELVITRSEKGMSLFSERGRKDFPVAVKEVCDVTGAGDTALATITFALAAGFTSTQALELANVASGIAVAHLGCARVSLSEIAERLVELHSRNKIYYEDHLFALGTLLNARPHQMLTLNDPALSILSIHSKLLEMKRLDPDKMTIVHLNEGEFPQETIELLSSLEQVDAIVLGSNLTENELLKNFASIY